MCIEAAGISTDDLDVLISARSLAAAAENALLIVSYEVSAALLNLKLLSYALEAVNILNAIFEAELLKLAVVGTNTGEALFIVIGEKKLESSLSGLANLLRVCLDFHTLVDGIDAGSDE